MTLELCPVKKERTVLQEHLYISFLDEINLIVTSRV